LHPAETYGILAARPKNRKRRTDAFCFHFPAPVHDQDFFELHIPLVGDIIAKVFQRIINFLPL
jgi:hypothetical protein